MVVRFPLADIVAMNYSLLQGSLLAVIVDTQHGMGYGEVARGNGGSSTFGGCLLC